jgi:2-polyprenyl-3-methyl-5-hydroxy-6-metoxy-1,4-benzoquinol methylase
VTETKAWDWTAAKEKVWLEPSEESYYLVNRWKTQGRKSILDLGCGLGRHSILFAKNGFDVSAMDLSP